MIDLGETERELEGLRAHVRRCRTIATVTNDEDRRRILAFVRELEAKAVRLTDKIDGPRERRISRQTATSTIKRRLAQAPYSWTGFYVGGQFGYGFGRSTQPALGFSDPAGAGVGTFYEAGGISIGSYPSQGVLGGVQAGYNYQIAKWVLGFEADWAATGINGSRSAPAMPDPAIFGGTNSVANISQSLDWLATFRGRVGVNADNWLFYGTGGLALGRVRNAMDVTIFTPIPYAFSFAGANGNTQVGWTAGVGTEVAVGRFSIKAEYLYYDLGSNRLYAPTADPLLVPGGTLTLDQYTSGHIVRAGINFHF
jgi:outer membrane immunogenic protein